VYYMYLVIFGMHGALSRYGISMLIGSGEFPLATLCVNLFGCFSLAFLMQYIAKVTSLSPKFISAIGTGFIGSFTTFSAFAFESSSLIQSGEYFYAGTYIFISLFGGLIGCILGYWLSDFLLVQRKRRNHFVE